MEMLGLLFKDDLDHIYKFIATCVVGGAQNRSEEKAPFSVCSDLRTSG
jgi:hypothetical protein